MQKSCRAQHGRFLVAAVVRGGGNERRLFGEIAGADDDKFVWYDVFLKGVANRFGCKSFYLVSFFSFAEERAIEIKSGSELCGDGCIAAVLEFAGFEPCDFGFIEFHFGGAIFQEQVEFFEDGGFDAVNISWVCDGINQEAGVCALSGDGQGGADAVGESFFLADSVTESG